MTNRKPSNTLEQWHRYYEVSQRGALTCLKPREAGTSHYNELVKDISTLVLTLSELAEAGTATPAVRMDFGELGAIDYYPFSPQFIMALNHEMRSIGSEAVSAYHAAQWCVFRVRLAGELEEGLGRQAYHQQGLSCSFVYFGSGLNYRVQLLKDHPMSGVSLLFRPEFITTLLGDEGRSILDTLVRPDGGEGLQTQMVSVAITPAIVSLARHLLALDTSASLAALGAQSKALELLAAGLLGLVKSTEPDLRPVHLSEPDLQQLNVVKTRLESEFEQHHTIEQLSRWAGLNRRKLTEGFKSLFGVTISHYLLCQRMGRARELLEEGVAVGDVAMQVGYNDAASFSRAFKRSEGLSPTQYSSS